MKGRARASLLPLALAALLPRAAVAADQSVLLQADEIVYDGNTEIVVAQGHVEIVDQGRILMAETVTYDQKTDQVTASGHVSVMDAAGNVAFADHVTLTGGLREGALSGFGALIGKNGRMVAASAERVGGRTTIAHNATYSPCKICNQPGHTTPVWQVKAVSIVDDQEAHRIQFHSATIDMFGVPVLYTPYLSEPDPTVKYASGILVPTIGNSTILGYFARVPVYISLSDSNDLTVEPMASTHGGGLLEAEYRQRWDNGGLWFQGSGAYNPHGGLGDTGPQTYGHLFGSGLIDLDDKWSTGFNVQLTSNNAYMEDYDISRLQRLVNDLFVENDDDRSRFAIMGYYFQGLLPTDIASDIPYVLPMIDYNYIPSRNVLGGQFRFDLNSAVVGQNTGPDSQRLTAEMRWRLPFVFADGQLWTIQVDTRGDLYHVDNDGLDPVGYPTIPTGSYYVSRAIPYIALDWRWPFVAEARTGNSFILQPIAQFIAQPYGGNPKDLPVEDASDFEFDANNLFSADQLPGYDLVESGPRANVGFRAEAIYPTGELDALLGQTYRLKQDPVFDSLTGETGSVSDIIARVSVKIPHLSLVDEIDLDHSNGDLERQEVELTGTYGPSSLQISYVQLPPETTTQALLTQNQEEITAQGDLNFYENWQAFAAINRDLLSGQFLDTEYGIGYEDECLAVSIAYRRIFASDIAQGVPPSTSIILRFSLKTGDQPIKPFNLFPQNVFSKIYR